MLLLLTTSRNPGKNKIMAKLKISLVHFKLNKSLSERKRKEKKRKNMHKTHKKGSAALIKKNWRMYKQFSTVLWYRKVSRSKKAVGTCKAKWQFLPSSRALTISLKQHQRDTNKVFALWRHASVISLKDMLVIITILCIFMHVTAVLSSNSTGPEILKKLHLDTSVT